MKKRYFVLFALFTSACAKPQYELKELPLGIEPTVELLSQENIKTRLSTIPGVKILFFGFTRCPDFCPLTMHTLDAAIQAAHLSEKIRLLFVSVDSAHETPANLKAFLAAYPYATGFTGSQEAIQRLEKSLGAYSKVESGKLSHSLFVYVLNEKNKVVYLLKHDDPREKISAVLSQAAGF